MSVQALIQRCAILAVSTALTTGIAGAQNPAPQPPHAIQSPDANHQAVDTNREFLEKVMDTASTIHQLVRNMNLQKSITAYPPGDPRANDRTAMFIGVGAGVGMALAEMTHGSSANLSNQQNAQRNEMIGAAAGAAGGLVADQILRHQAAKAQAAREQMEDQIPVAPVRKLLPRPPQN